MALSDSRHSDPPATEGAVDDSIVAPVVPFRLCYAEIASAETASAEPTPDNQPTLLSVRAIDATDVPAATLQADWVIADTYRIERLIREGGMGRVYEATHTALGQSVCLKTLRPDLTRGDDAALLIERFRLEALAAGRLDHPNVIRVLDFGQDSTGQLYLAMDLVRGKDLEDVLREEFPLGEERVCHIMAQVLDALSEAHAHGVVHRDLKPGNIMLEQRVDAPDFVKVVDFGIAKVEGASKLTQTGFVTGTAQYMAPEQASGQAIDARTDVYAAGCVLYELVTRTIPFTDENATSMMYAHVNTPPVPPRIRRPEVVISAELEGLILRALRKNPAERPQTAAAFRDELLALKARARQRRETLAFASEQARRDDEMASLSARLAELRSATPPRTEMLPVGQPQTPAGHHAQRNTVALFALFVAAGAIALAAWVVLTREAPPSVITVSAPSPPTPEVARTDPEPEQSPSAEPEKTSQAPPSSLQAEQAEPAPTTEVLTAAPSTDTPTASPARAPPPPRPTGPSTPPSEVMVRIQGGVSLVGCEEGSHVPCPIDARPAIAFDVNAFRIDVNEVTVSDYARCVRAGACTAPRTGDGCVKLAGNDQRPVNCVSFAQASAYCDWRGARLPTEFEWERAARGADGRLFPWGNAAPTCDTAAFGACGGQAPAPIGARPAGATPEGVKDLAGNVREWTSTFYSRNTYVVGRAPLRGQARVVRGGSFQTTSAGGLAAWARGSFTEDRSYPDLGFRCAR